MEVTNIKVYGLEESIVASGFAMSTDTSQFDWEVSNLKHFLNMNILAILESIKDLPELELHEEYFSAFYSFGEVGCTCSFKYEDYLEALSNSVDTTRFGCGAERLGLTGEWNVLKALPHLKRADRLFNCNSSDGHDCALCGIIVQMNVKFSEKAWPELQRYHFMDIETSQSVMHRITKMEIDECCNKYVTKEAKENLKRLVAKYNETNDKEDLLAVYYNVPSGLELTARITTNYRQLKTIYRQRRTHRLPDWHSLCDVIEDLPFSEWIIEKKEK